MSECVCVCVMMYCPITGTLARLPLQNTVINCKRECFPEEIVIKD